MLAIAFEPFAQQLVQYEDNVVYTLNENVTLPIAKRYDAGSAIEVAATALGMAFG
jgi:hypothetical protein